MTTNPDSIYAPTCANSGTLNFKRVGYGSLGYMICRDCQAKVTTKNDGTIRKHPVGGKVGILTGPRGEG